MFKRLIIYLILHHETNALKSRLAEASHALKRIETAVVSIEKGASPEVHALAAKILERVLSSSDEVRTKAEFTHEWEANLYRIYNSGKSGVCSTLDWAYRLLDKSKVFF